MTVPNLARQVYKGVRGGVTTVAVKVMQDEAVLGGSERSVLGRHAKKQVDDFNREARPCSRFVAKATRQFF